MKKETVLAKIKAEKVVAIIRADSPDGLLDCARALAAGGLTSIELTMTTPGAIAMLEKASAELPDFLFGLGTVLDPETARAGILAGAKFIVTPALRPEVVTLCRRYSVPVFCGALTPTEIVAAWEAGADAVKVFPGAAGSALVDAKSLKEKNWAAITAKAQAFVKAVAAAGK